MRLGGREIELSECFPAGAAYPEAAAAHDVLFQHIAIVTDDIGQAYQRALAHGAVAISNGGPQTLPASSGGVIAWKFRDPEGHPLELLQFPDALERSGYDHTAISVADVARSVTFYEGLGLSLGARSLNRGAAQAALDGLQGAVADVLALRPARATPHVELLHYRAPGRGVFASVQAKDVAADRMVFAADDAGLLRDPDGHFVLLEPRTEP
jgi:catechol 2,3-dioxygenase-like lactoylglutathione lyase family enzyme